MRRLKLVIPILLASAPLSWAQNDASASADRASAYYHYTLAHMYAQMAAEAVDRVDYVNQAIDHYKEAIAADPLAREITDELSEVYLQFDPRRGRNDAETAIRANPNDVAAHRLLARLFLREASDARNNRIDVTLLRRSIEEYETVTRLDPQDVESWVLLGRLHSAIENRDGAEAAYQKALEIESDNEDALVGLASIYADRDEADKASELLKRAADKNPTSASLDRLATAYQQMNEFALAAETLRKALEFNPPDAAELREKMADNLLRAGRFEDAIAVFEEVARDDPDDSGPQVQLSRLYMQIGDVEKAREAVDKAEAIDPDDIEVRYQDAHVLRAEGKTADSIDRMRGILEETKRTTYNPGQSQLRTQLLQEIVGMYAELEQTDEAVAGLRELIDLNPAIAPALTASIIDTLRGGKQFDRAQQEAGSAARRWPDDRSITIARATLDADLGRVDQAAAAVRKLLDGADDRQIHLALSQIYEKGRQWDRVAAALNEAEKLSNTDLEKYILHFRRGAMYERMKDIAKAEAEFRQCLELMPDDPGALNYLGYMLADRDMRLPEALDMIEKAVEKEPGNGAYLDSLGWVYFRMGRFMEAEEQIRRAVELMPGDPTMHDHFGEVLIRQSKVREAIAAWEESLRQWNLSSPADKDTADIDRVRGKLEAARGRLERESRQ